MIICRAPFRLSFFGGGTDVPWFYRQGSGLVYSTTIKKYVLVSVHKMFDSSDILLKYSEVERVSKVEQIKHFILREALSRYVSDGIEVSVSAEIPSGTGLGSSSSFTVCLLQALRLYNHLPAERELIAEEACYLEINQMSQAIGKQDQYAAAYGGLNRFEFRSDESVEVTRIELSEEARKTLDDSLFLVRVGQTRSAESILLAQHEAFSKSTQVRLAYDKMLAFTSGISSDVFEDLPVLGLKLQEVWELKKELHPDGTNSEIDSVIKRGINSGSLGAKLLGAGQGGFVFFLVPKERQEKFIRGMKGCNIMKVNLDFDGCIPIYRH